MAVDREVSECILPIALHLGGLFSLSAQLGWRGARAPLFHRFHRD